jgi:predicted DNA binding CopG/RHH family protein
MSGPKLGVTRPKTSAAKTQLEEGLGRLVVDLPAPLFRQMKIHVATRGITMKAYLIELLEADLAKRGGVG